MPNVKLLDSDKSTDFTSFVYGNINAGSASTPPKLLFAYSFESGTASGSQFGIQQVGIGDGYNMVEICSATAFNASGSAITGAVVASGGTIDTGTSLTYALTVRTDHGGGVFHESAMDTGTYAPTIAVSGSKVNVSWTAVSGADDYGLYLSLDSGSTYGRIGYITAVSYTDTSGTVGTATLASGADYAYRSGTWQSGTSPISMGALASGTMIPLMTRINVPSGTSATGNTRQFNHYVSYLGI